MKSLSFIPLTFLAFSSVQAATIAPKITNISVTPNAATAGQTFTFSATLNAPLAAGSKIKIDTLGKGFTAMTGSNTSYSLSRAIFTTGTLTYKVAIVDAKSVVQGAIKTGSYTVKSPVAVNHAPKLTLVGTDKSATVNVKYTVTLNAKDIDANLSSITMNWGDSAAPETLIAEEGKNLVFSHTFTTTGDFALSAFASDKGTPVLKSNKFSKTITVKAPPAVITLPVVTPVITQPTQLPITPTIVVQPSPVVNTAESLAGNWKIHIDENDGNSTGCGDGIQSFDFNAMVSVMGNSVTVSLPTGNTLKGTLLDNSMTFQNTTFEDGMTTNSSGTLTFQNGKITGTSNYLVSSPDGNCPGTDVITGSKM
jgi:hypothetical protein